MESKRELIKDNSELRLAARKQLRGNWGMAILLVMVFWIITSVIAYIGPSDSPYRIGVVISWVLSGPFAFGLAKAFLTIVRTQSVKFEVLFDGFKRFGQAFLVQLLRSIFIGLWSIPMIIFTVLGVLSFLGSAYFTELSSSVYAIFFILAFASMVLPIIASLRYSMVFYILNDNPEMASMDALRLSKEMTKGFKGKLFLLYLSFIGWFILGTLALLIGLLWVVPYVQTSIANFYENLKEASVTVEDSKLFEDL